MGTVVLIIRLAHLTLHTRLHLCTNTNPITSLDVLDLLTDTEDLANDLMPNADWSMCDLAPSTGDSVHIAATDTAAFILDIDIILFKDFRSKLSEAIVSTSF
jgi:hypothetical protein